MQIRAELYPEEIGVDNNVLKVLQTKECKILLTFKSDRNDTRFQCVLGKEEVKDLMNSLSNCLEVADSNGFKLISAKATDVSALHEPKQTSDCRDQFSGNPWQ